MSSPKVLEDPSFELGGWLLSCNPKKWDVVTFRDSAEPLNAWSIAQSYRLDHLETGHRIALWVNKSDPKRAIPGIWAVGVVTGEPFIDSGDPDDDYWTSDEERRKHSLYLPIAVQFLDQPIDASVLADDPSFATASILSQPFGSNPHPLSDAEWAAIDERLPDDFEPPNVNLSQHDAAVLAVAERTGLDLETVDEVLSQQQLLAREHVRDGVALFNPVGCSSETGHPAPALVGGWPPVEPVSNLGDYLDSLDDLKRLGSEWAWDILPEAILEQAEELFAMEPAVVEVVLEAFWAVVGEAGETDPFESFNLELSRREICDELQRDPSWTKEYGHGSVHSASLPDEVDLLFRMSGSGDVVGVVIETTRASQQTLARVSRVLDRLQATASGSVGCLVVADGRDADYRRATADREDLHYLSAQRVIEAATPPV